MIVKLLTEHHLEFLSLTGDCRGSSESTLVKMLNCWKSHAAAQIQLPFPLFSGVHNSSSILLSQSLSMPSPGTDGVGLQFLINDMSQCMSFPTMWYFDMCRLGRASAASF